MLEIQTTVASYQELVGKKLCEMQDESVSNDAILESKEEVKTERSVQEKEKEWQFKWDGWAWTWEYDCKNWES